MTGALVILLAMVVVGTLLFITDKKYYRHHHATEPVDEIQSSVQQNPTEEDICCGQHLVCEKTSLRIDSDEIIYYDDEELDRFKGRSADSYTEEESDEFRDVMLTLLPEDVAGWAKSITLREIELPSDIRDELFLLVTDLR